MLLVISTVHAHCKLNYLIFFHVWEWSLFIGQEVCLKFLRSKFYFLILYIFLVFYFTHLMWCLIWSRIAQLLLYTACVRANGWLSPCQVAIMALMFQMVVRKWWPRLTPHPVAQQQHRWPSRRPARCLMACFPETLAVMLFSIQLHASVLCCILIPDNSPAGNITRV